MLYYYFKHNLLSILITIHYQNHLTNSIPQGPRFSQHSHTHFKLFPIQPIKIRVKISQHLSNTSTNINSPLKETTHTLHLTHNNRPKEFQSILNFSVQSHTYSNQILISNMIYHLYLLKQLK